MSNSLSNPLYSDQKAKKNAIILAISFALGGVTTFSVMSLAASIGFTLAEDKGNATLPITTFLIASMLTSIPASMLMQRIGRKSGFQIGVSFGVMGCLLAAFSIYVSSFLLLCTATALIGVMGSFQGFYRFAAADSASDAFKSRAISWVMFGGVVAPIFAPSIITYSKNMLDPYFIAGTFVVAAGISCITFIMVTQIDIPHEETSERKNTGRSLIDILKQPLFIIAVAAGVISYGLMTFVMTATPLAILGCGQGYDIDDVTFIIQWHAIAMYGPAFFTGKIIQRVGEQAVIISGLIMLILCAIIAAMGVEVTHFWAALVLLGLGWNFGFVGATSLLTKQYKREERFKAQAFNDFMVFGFLAIGSYASGKIYFNQGWDGVLWLVYPLAGLAIILVIISLFIKPKQ